MSPTRTPVRQRPSERGIALALALFTMAALLVAASGALFVGTSDIKATRNYRGAAQVHFAAESAILDALQTVNGAGVVNFQNEVANAWSTVWGTLPRTFAPFAGFTYIVAAAASGTDPSNAGMLVATANGPEGVKNVVVARVARSNIPSTSPGAMYLATDARTDSSFNGNAFAVDGNDHDYRGGPGTAPPIPGISTRTDTNTQEALSSLAAAQKDNVTGYGYSNGPPIVPSIMTSPAAPTLGQLSQIITDLLARPRPPDVTDTQINGNVTYGTPASPQITHFTGNGGVTIKGTGNASGAGIMIVEGDLTIEGNFDFTGLVLVRGKTNVAGTTDVTGNATVYGSIWTEDVNLVIGGSAIVYYSSSALALANQVSGGAALPAPLTVLSLADCAAVPARSSGCP